MPSNIILFDQPTIKTQLLPFTFTRPIADIRCGIFTIAEKWAKQLHAGTSYLTDNYLVAKYLPVVSDENIIVKGHILPDAELVQAINQLKKSDILFNGDEWIAACLSANDVEILKHSGTLAAGNHVKYEKPVSAITRPWHIFQLNGQEIVKDFALVKGKRLSSPIKESNRAINHNDIFIEEGAEVDFCILNAEKGPIYIGRNARVMEGSIIRGPFAALEGVEIKMGAKIYGPTTFGPYCKMGGEVNNSVVFGYSNKAHEGYLGNSVLGEWCNLGADTNNSNLKNDYTNVKVWSYKEKSFTDTGLQFCGLIMGDHSKCGINTMFNTGTVVGVSCNIFGDGFPRNFIPSYSWGGAAGFMEYKYDKAIKVAKLVMDRKNIPLSQQDADILKYIFELKER